MAGRPKTRSPAIKRTSRQKKRGPKGVVVGARYLVKRKKTNYALRTSDAVLAEILDLADDAIISIDEAQVISRFNRGAARIFGYVPDEIIGQSLDLLIPDQFVEAHRRHIVQFADSPGSSRPMALRGQVLGRRKDGSEFPAEASISKLEVAGKKTFTVFLRDVTERWNLEHELERKNSILSTQQETSLDAILLVNEHGKIVSFNRRFVDLWGIPDEVIASRSDERALQSVLDKLEAPREFIERVTYLYEHKEEKCRDVIRTKDGRTVDRFTAPVVGSEGEYYGRIWYFRDITERQRAEQDLRYREAQLRTFLNESPSLMFMKDTEGRYVFVNDRFKEAYGLTTEQVLSHTDAEIFSAGQAAQFAAHDARVFAGRTPVEVEEAAQYTDGLHTNLVAKFPIFDDGGKIINWGAIATDITDWNRAVLSLKRANRALRVLSAVNQALIRAESEHVLLDQVCKVLVELGGYRMAWIGFVEHDERKSIRPVAQTGYEAGYLGGVAITWADTERGRGPTGTAVRTGTLQVSKNIGADPRMAAWRDDALKRDYASSIALPLVSETVTFGVLSIYAKETDAFDFEEVTLLEELAADLAFGIATHRSNVERHRAEARAERLANFDSLTELPNRVQLIIRLGAAIEGARLRGEPLALMTLSVDRFSEIQDGIGIAGSDDLLKNIASRLRNAVDHGNFLARIADESFALVIPKADAGLARASVARLQEVMINPFEFAGIPLDVQSTIGVALFPSHGADPDSLIRRSDIAIRQARAAGADYALYSGESETESPTHLTLLAELRKAIRDGGLLLFYQPKIDVHAGRVCGVEALVRWQHPERGLVPPNDFIPLAEHTGLIRPITYWVMDAALKQIVDWRQCGIEIPIAVNVSPNNLRDPEFLGYLEALRVISGANFGLLELELTETALMEDPARSHEVLARIRDLGVRISIDDFGTGYSSLSYIATLPVHALKIDRVFVHNMMQQARHRAVVAAAISLAHSLGLKVVAEGIESADQAQALIQQDCDELQGYLFCRPLPPDEFARWQFEFAWERFGLGGPNSK